MTKGHLSIDIALQDLNRENLQEVIAKGIYIPDNDFPPRFLVNNEDFFIGGYFVSYHPRMKIEELVLLCKKGNWRRVAELNADFIIVYFNYKSREIRILTDQSGKFPCYYRLSSQSIFVSTSFFEVMKKMVSLTLDIEKTLEFIYRDTSVSTRTFIERFDSLQSFSDRFLLVLEKSVQDRLLFANEFNFGSDISSGFDSALVTYLL